MGKKERETLKDVHAEDLRAMLVRLKALRGTYKAMMVVIEKELAERETNHKQ